VTATELAYKAVKLIPVIPRTVARNKVNENPVTFRSRFRIVIVHFRRANDMPPPPPPLLSSSLLSTSTLAKYLDDDDNDNDAKDWRGIGEEEDNPIPAF